MVEQIGNNADNLESCMYTAGADRNGGEMQLGTRSFRGEQTFISKFSS